MNKRIFIIIIKFTQSMANKDRAPHSDDGLHTEEEIELSSEEENAQNPDDDCYECDTQEIEMKPSQEEQEEEETKWSRKMTMSMIKEVYKDYLVKRDISIRETPTQYKVYVKRTVVAILPKAVVYKDLEDLLDWVSTQSV